MVASDAKAYEMINNVTHYVHGKPVFSRSKAIRSEYMTLDGLLITNFAEHNGI